MLHLVLLFCLYCQIVYCQTACQFFSSVDHNYTAWSESHIATWCKDHDPSSTSQCARAVVWPPYIQYPGRVKFRRNIKEWFLQLDPRIGTRKDCIARSFVLHLNSTRHANGLSEAATCDLYYFHPKRRDECVCFPVYNDLITQTSTVVDGIYRVVETTSVFYPPEQIVESCLLAAATQGPPTVCNSHKSKCQQSVDVVGRKPRALGDFPYCPTPGPQARQHLPARTVGPWDHYDVTPSTTVSSTKSWGPLPTGPDCARNDEEKSLCKNDKCMWSFIMPAMSPKVTEVTFTDTDGVFLFVTQTTDFASMSAPHWGFVPQTKEGNGEKKRKKTTSTTTSTYDASRFKSAQSNFEQLGMSEFISSPPSTPTPSPLCHDELSCREWCDERIKAPLKHMMALLVGGTGFTALAGLAMLLKIYGKRIRRWYKTRAGHDRSSENDGQCLIDAGSVQGLELVQVPSGVTRGRGRVRFQDDGADSAAELLDGSDNSLRRVGGHELRA